MTVDGFSKKVPELTALSDSIQRTLENLFGENTAAFHRFSAASRVRLEPSWGDEPWLPNRLQHDRQVMRENIARSVVLLERAIETLEQDIAEAEEISEGLLEGQLITGQKMKRDKNLIRELLLKLQGLPMRAGGVVTITPDAEEIAVQGYTTDQIDYHLEQIRKDGFIDEGGARPMIGIGFRSLTSRGHDFLDREQEQQPNEGVLHASSATIRKVFVVHGHDEGARESIARFLEKIGFEAIILHEQASQGRTVIEKVEAHGNVGFAVVLLTPDDEGCAKGGTPMPRARQNVLIELGYFIGRLGRKHVCALKRGEIEIPSDFGGVVYETFDASGGWKQALGKELKAAGYEIDWNKVMGRP